jgi:MFS family permease
MSGLSATGSSTSAAARPRSVARRVGDALTMFLVTGLSLVLLVYVGFGEGKRTYGDFHVDKVAAQAGIVRNSMEAFLRHGLPVRQYVGFGTLTQPIVDTADIAGMVAYDRDGREIFRNLDRSKPDVPSPPPGATATADGVTVNQTDDFYQVVLPLRTRFETVGSLVATSFKSVVTDRVSAAFRPVLLLAIALSAVFAAFVTFAGPALVRGRMPWLQISYAVTFLAAASIVILTLVSLYSEGVQGKARALADTLGQRVGELIAFNLSLRDFEGLDRAFDEYRRINTDISAAALIENDRVRIHTDRDKVGKPWVADPRNYEYLMPVGRSGDTQLSIAIAVPRDIVLRQVTRSVKNFAALFVASAFLAGLFLQVAASLQNVGRGAGEAGDSVMTPRASMSASVVKPLFFIAIFLEHMTYSFLPQYMRDIVTAAGFSPGLASAPFMAYYLFFALSLIPSGHVAQNFGPRVLIHGGLILAGMGLLVLVLPVGFWGVIGARVVSGIGQGMLFIGVQSYILANASSDKRTQGNGIIVFGFQGGMISGMAIGSLLVTYMGPAGIFKLAGLLACVTALYGLMVVPAETSRRTADVSLRATVRRLGTDISHVLRNSQFMQTMFLIGIPAKAALTGVVTFALPLLLAQQHYKQEDIGQIIMLYAIGVVVASHYVARFVDRTGHTAHVLTFGAAVSGIGMIVVGQTEWTALGNLYGELLPTVIIAVGVMVVGIAHGCVNAPVVTHIAELKLTHQIGVDATTATYRFLERVGHIAGPIIAGQMFLMIGISPVVVTWFGAATIILAIAFFALFDPRDQAPHGAEKHA